MSPVLSIPWALFFATYVLAYVRGEWDDTRTRRAHRLLLRATSGVLLVAAVLWWAELARGTRLETYAGWVALGMLLSFLGDLVTGGLLPFKRPYLVAIGVFAVGHVCYLVALAAARAAFSVPLDIAWWIAGMAMGTLAWATVIRRPGSRSLMNWLALGYALILGSVLGMSLSLGLQRDALALLAAGAVLFSISDVLLGNRELRKNSWFMMYDVIWAFYILGQLLIVSSVPWALEHGPLLSGSGSPF